MNFFESLLYFAMLGFFGAFTICLLIVATPVFLIFLFFVAFVYFVTLIMEKL